MGLNPGIFMALISFMIIVCTSLNLILKIGTSGKEHLDMHALHHHFQVNWDGIVEIQYLGSLQMLWL